MEDNAVVVSCRFCSRLPTHVCCAHIPNPYLCGIHARTIRNMDIAVYPMSDEMKKEIHAKIKEYKNQPGTIIEKGIKVLENVRSSELERHSDR